MIKKVTIIVNIDGDDWSDFEEREYDDPKPIEEVRQLVRDDLLAADDLVYTDSSGKIDLMIDFTECRAYKVTYE